jgi:hypothetical protein
MGVKNDKYQNDCWDNQSEEFKSSHEKGSVWFYTNDSEILKELLEEAFSPENIKKQRLEHIKNYNDYMNKIFDNPEIQKTLKDYFEELKQKGKIKYD